jgi:hypothetical protein
VQPGFLFLMAKPRWTFAQAAKRSRLTKSGYFPTDSSARTESAAFLDFAALVLAAVILCRMNRPESRASETSFRDSTFDSAFGTSRWLSVATAVWLITAQIWYYFRFRMLLRPFVEPLLHRIWPR